MDQPYSIARLLQNLGWVRSSSEGMRKVREGAVRVQDVRIEDPGLVLSRGEEYLVQYGKKHFARVILR